MSRLQYLLELQRDGARSAIYHATVATAIAYGLGLIYASAPFGAFESH